MTSQRRITDHESPGGYGLPADAADMRQLVSFAIRGQNYCVDILAVREIRMWNGATALPNSSDFIRGVINLRGTIVPVVDLRMRFGLGLTETTAGHVVVIVAVDTAQIGLLVDSVSDIITVSGKDIADIPRIEGEEQNPFFQGLITDQEGSTALISLKEILSHRPGNLQSKATQAA